MAKKKYSINVENDKIVSVEVNGVRYAGPDDIPNEHDRAMVESLVMGAPVDDLEMEGAGSSALSRVIVGVFFGVSVLMLAIMVISAFIVGRAMSREVSVPGRVMDLIAVSGQDGTLLYTPLVEFTGVDNERQALIIGGASRPPVYRPGEPVTVRYDPAYPEAARIGSFWNDVGQFTVAIITGVLAAAFAGATLLARWIMKPEVLTQSN